MNQIRNYITEIIMVILGIALGSTFSIIPTAEKNTTYFILLSSLVFGIISMLILVLILKGINEDTDHQVEKQYPLKLKELRGHGIVPIELEVKKELITMTFLENLKKHSISIIVCTSFTLLSLGFLIYTSFIQETNNEKLAKNINVVLNNDSIIIRNQKEIDSILVVYKRCLDSIENKIRE